MLGVSASSFGFGRRTQLVTSSSQIPGITVYFDAAGNNFNPNSLDGTSISQWTDSSGASHNANPDGGNLVKPTVKTNILNGKTILRFDGGDNLSVTSATYLQSKVGFTLYAVAKVTTYNVGNTAITSSNATGGGAKIYHDGTHWAVRIAQCTGVSTLTGDNNFHTFGLIYDGTGAANANRVRFRYGGTEQSLTYTGTAEAATSSTIDIFYIGNDAKAQFLTGDIGEVAIWTRTLNNSEILAVEAYLKNKWGVD